MKGISLLTLYAMKRMLITAAILLASTVCAVSQPQKKSSITLHTVHSAAMNEDVAVNVYLPAGYDPAGEKLYPAVYLLHGLYGNYSDWEKRGHMKEVADELIASGEAEGMIIIMPNAGGSDVRNVFNGYFNVPGHPYEDFFFGELIPGMEKRLRIKGDREHRAVMGLSMGGGGSTVYCQRHPDMFSSCYAMSAWLDEKRLGDEKKDKKLYLVRKSVREHSALDFLDNADEATLEKLRGVSWFIDCGDDDFLLDLNTEFYKRMREKKIKAEFRVRNGIHNWEYWHQALRLALPFASRNFGSKD